MQTEMTELYVVRHRGHLDIAEWVASHQVVGGHPTETINETLVEATPAGVEHLMTHVVGIIGITPAVPGRFADDEAGAAIVNQDGSWGVEEAES